MGGSLVTDDSTSRVVQELKRALSLPVVLFPGAPNQISGHADAMLFLSLISGRNPDLLIGRHVEAAPHLAKLQLETVPTGYMLIGDPPLTAAAYMSHSLPIPLAKPELAVATALAGEMLGLRCLYLDAGSGAGTPIPSRTIRAIRDVRETAPDCGRRTHVPGRPRPGMGRRGHMRGGRIGRGTRARRPE